MIISQGKESLLSSSDESSSYQGISVKPYSRFDMHLLAIQSDKVTFSREPDTTPGDFENWTLGFKLEDKSSEIVDLINQNKHVKEIYEEIVPVEVDAETFWRRYFYRVYKLDQAEEARLKLVNSAISGEEEDFSWDLDDESAKSEDNSKAKKDGKGVEKVLLEAEEEEEKAESSRDVSSKDSDISVISTQPSLPEVEDLGWDKMEEDIRSNQVKSLDAVQGTEQKSDWQRRVGAAEDGEDLTWDIEDEDDDDSVKQ